MCQSQRHRKGSPLLTPIESPESAGYDQVHYEHTNTVRKKLTDGLGYHHFTRHWTAAKPLPG